MFRRSCFIVLRLLLSRLRAKNLRSEVADVTGIVKYIGKSVFWHQPPPPPGGGSSAPCSPTPPPMKPEPHNSAYFCPDNFEYL